MSELTSRERVKMAINHQEPDRVPYYVSFTQVAGSKLEAYYGSQDIDIVIGNDMVRYSPRSRTMDEIHPGFFRDEFGVVWNRTVDKDIGMPEAYPLKERSLAGFTFPDPREVRRYQGLPDFINRYAGRYLLISYAHTYFERAWSLRSMPEILVDMLEAPEWVEELMDALAEYNLLVIDEFLKYDIDGFLFGDDWGQQQGLLFSPQLWRRFIKPRLVLLVDRVKQAGRGAFIHSCGKIQDLFPDIIEIGVDVFNPFQPDVMDALSPSRPTP